MKTYLPDFELSDDATTDAVTTRQLLTHTSGIADLDFGLFGRGDDCVERFITALAGRPMLHDPGAFCSYCNSGFVVAGRLIEVLRKQTWDAALREHIIKPLGMTRTVTLAEEAMCTARPRSRAARGRIPAAASVWGIPRSAGPAGLIVSTVEDVLTFAQLHLDDGRPAFGGVARAMRDAHATGAEGSRGLAWHLFAWGGVDAVGHDGGTFGQLAFLRVVPERRFAYALLTNSYQAALVHRDLLREVVGERLGLDVPDVPSAPEPPIAIDGERYAGRWTWQGLTVDIGEQDGALAATLVLPAEGEAPPPEIPPIPMTAIGDDAFLVRVPPIDIDRVLYFLEADDDGRFTHADLRGRLMIKC